MEIMLLALDFSHNYLDEAYKGTEGGIELILNGWEKRLFL